VNVTRTTALILSLALTMGVARADWNFDAETGALYDSNLSNSDRAADEKADWAWTSDLRAEYGFQVTRDLRLRLGGDIAGNVWDRFYAFNKVDLGSSIGLRYRFGLGRRAPWVMADDHLAYEFFDENARDGWSNNFQIRGGMAITDRLSIETGYTFDHFAARDRFFDLEGHNGFARLTFELTPSLQISLGYNYRNGDVISYAVPPRPDIFALTSEARPVTTFGTNPLYIAYRLSASTNSVSVSAGYSATKYLSVLVSYEYSVTSHDPLEYENHLVEAKVAFAY
jgi:hypothetical protein